MPGVLWHFNVVGSIDAFPSEKRDNIFSYELLIQKHRWGRSIADIYSLFDSAGSRFHQTGWLMHRLVLTKTTDFNIPMSIAMVCLSCTLVVNIFSSMAETSSTC